MLLKRGKRGQEVREFQEILFQLGYDPNGIDGIFDCGTDKAVRQLQNDSCLVVDGKVGKNTWHTIFILLDELRGKVKSFKHYKIGNADIFELDPMQPRISVQDKPAHRINLPNFVTAGYQWHWEDGETYPLGILVSEGQILSNRQPHAYIPGKWLPAGTLIVYKDGTVKHKELSNIDGEKDAWFVISGCTIYPDIKMKSAGFIGRFEDIARKANRPIIGYSAKKNKLIIVVAPKLSIKAAKKLAKKLGMIFCLTLDAGGSTVLRLLGRFIFKTVRRLYAVLTWD